MAGGDGYMTKQGETAMKSRSFFHFIVIVLFFIFGSVATPTQAKPLSALGDFVWAMGLGSPGFDAGSDIAVDGDGNVYTTGYFSGNVDFDPGPGTAYLTAAGYWASDIFVSKLDTNGNFVWAINMGGTGYEEGAGIAVDGNGNIYITGYFNGTSDFDPGLGVANLTSAGREDIFISKLDANGNYLWVKGMGGSEVDQGYSIAVDREGNVYTTGYFQGTADFDPGPDIADLVSAGERTRPEGMISLFPSLIPTGTTYGLKLLGVLQVSMKGGTSRWTRTGMCIPQGSSMGPPISILAHLQQT